MSLPVSFADSASPQRGYRYRAVRPDGAIESGIVSAISPDAAAEAIAGRGHWVLVLKPASRSLFARGRIAYADLGLGLRLLASLLESGLSVTRALTAWREVAPEAWRPALPEIHDAVRHGNSLGTALENSPLGVPPVVIGIIKAGEAGSGLAHAVRRAATLMETAASTAASIRAALAYPLILAAAGTGSVALLVGVVLPRFATILADLGQALPPTTRLVLDIAQSAQTYAVPGALCATAVAVVWYRWTTTPRGRVGWHGWLLSLPLVGPIRNSAAAGRYARALGALLESGVPVAIALRSAADATGDAAISVRVLCARERVIRGERLSAALGAEHASTATAVQLVRAGEETGRLAEMLTYLAGLEQERAERAVKSAVRLLEPAMILVFGGLVALVAAALLQAVYSVRPGA